MRMSSTFSVKLRNECPSHEQGGEPLAELPWPFLVELGGPTILFPERRKV